MLHCDSTMSSKDVESLASEASGQKHALKANTEQHLKGRSNPFIHIDVEFVKPYQIIVIRRTVIESIYVHKTSCHTEPPGAHAQRSKRHKLWEGLRNRPAAATAFLGLGIWRSD